MLRRGSLHGRSLATRTAARVAAAAAVESLAEDVGPPLTWDGVGGASLWYIALALAWLIAASAWAQAEPADRAAVSASVGREPMYCAATHPDRQLCTWRDARTFHLVCELDGSGKRTAAPCIRQPDNVEMWTFPTTSQTSRPGSTVRKTKRSRTELIAAARAELDAAQSLEQVVERIGAGPVWCQRGDGLVCSWHAVRRTPGYMRLSRIANAPGKKVNVRCGFDADGRSHGPGTCDVTVGGRPEAMH